MADGWRTHRKITRRLVLALAVSAALHVVLIGLFPQQERYEGIGATTLIGLLRPVQKELPGDRPGAGGTAPASSRGPKKAAATRGGEVVPGERRDPRIVTVSLEEEPSDVRISVPGWDPDRFLPVALLDAIPQPRGSIAVKDPRAVGGSIPYAEVRLLAMILKDGRVAAIEPLPDSANADLRKAAVDAVLAARFTPGRREGRAVDSRLVVVVRFGSD